MPAVTIAQDVRLTPDIPSKSITLATGETLVIERNQDTAHQLSGEFTKTSRACPPFCIQEMSAGEGVETVGEIEVISFLENSVAAGNGLLLDSRMPEWFAKGTIPGAINVPFATLEASNPYRDEIIKALGAQSDGTTWDFAAATGSIAVPSALRTEAGRVDTATLLAALVRKSNPEAAITPTIDTNSNGVEVRVVQRAGETKRYNFYTVQSGDSLGAIAHRFYGDAAFYTSIFDANRQILSSPDRVRAGQRLSIPEITSG